MAMPPRSRAGASRTIASMIRRTRDGWARRSATPRSTSSRAPIRACRRCASSNSARWSTTAPPECRTMRARAMGSSRASRGTPIAARDAWVGSSAPVRTWMSCAWTTTTSAGSHGSSRRGPWARPRTLHTIDASWTARDSRKPRRVRSDGRAEKTTEQRMSKGKLVVLAVIAALIAAFFIFDLRQYLSLEYFKASRATIEAYRDSHPLQAALGFFGIYVVVTGLSLPGAAVLTLVAGAVFGLVWG